MTPPHPFDNAIHLDTIDGNVRRGRTHPEWANQVGPFGGITAAVMLRAIETQPDRIGEPLALTVNFTAPIADGDFDISLRARDRTPMTGPERMRVIHGLQAAA
jgi:hypothetical protein